METYGFVWSFHVFARFFNVLIGSFFHSGFAIPDFPANLKEGRLAPLFPPRGVGRADIFQPHNPLIDAGQTPHMLIYPYPFQPQIRNPGFACLDFLLILPILSLRMFAVGSGTPALFR